MPILELAFKILLDDALNGKVEALNKWEEHAEAHLFTTEQIKQALGVFRACDGSCLFRKSNALFLEAVWYHYGLLDDSGHSKTILYYEASIKLGHSTAMNNRAYMHQHGSGGEVNYVEAIRLYEAAIKLGNAAAMNNRAYMHEHGIGGDVNYKEAIRLYEAAITLGDTIAMSNRAYMHQHGIGGEVNYAEAIRLYETAIELDDADAMYDRACMHQHGIGGEVNYAEAIRLYEAAIELGESAAMNNRAYMHQHGIGGEVNYTEAIRLYEAAIKLGESAAMNNRAAMHVRGEGGEINSAEACRLYEAAIELGNAMAIYNRAYMHAHGLGGDKNYREALALYREYESKTHVKLDISDLHKKIITELKGNHELGNLYAQIDQMFQHGEAIGSAKGERVKAHAKNLEAKLDAFLLKHYEGNSLTGEKEQAFKAEFTQYLHSKDKDMGEHRAVWKPIIANILIALTGIGFVALLAKIIAHALTSHINKTDFSLNKACFFAETRTQCLALEIEQANNWTLCKA
ncbi:tetratricopeptide repeat protein [Legionella septentrionalis]|uniref:tetratricopeptide repeat protein n=1 Tax=Legionella septentrionalis TaxID=2498109 RepID=UPI000F8E65CB|nr:tetratricopeptide repeat protein [Legionella septentrionalis]RUR12644.1 sel1 repeat family protein [Legionella septentrionalis]